MTRNIDMGLATRLTREGRLDEAMAVLRGATAPEVDGDPAGTAIEMSPPSADNPAWRQASGHKPSSRTHSSPLLPKVGLAELVRLHRRAGRAAVVTANDVPPGAAFATGRYSGPYGDRAYRLFAPSSHSGQPAPLVVMLHGCTQSAGDFAAGTQMNALGERHGFFVLYPEQSRLANGQGCWNWFDTRSGRAHAEAGWIMSAIEQICVLYAADRRRVAVAGLSAGASMAALLATRYAERIRAVVMHSGVPPGTANSVASAVGAMRGRHASPTPPSPASTSTDWPPLMVIHGDGDPIVSASNADAAAQLWAGSGGAEEGATRTTRRGKRYPMQVTDFKRGGKLIVTRVLVPQLGHAWSGGKAGKPFSDAQGPDASRMAWAFAAKQFSDVPA